jgi:adenylate cyclase
MPKLTLNRVFLFSLLGLIAGLTLLFWVAFAGLENALLKSAEESRAENSAVISQSITDNLSQAPAAARHFESLLAEGLTNPADVHSLRDGLLAVLLQNDDISESTFTFARSSGFDGPGPDAHLVVDHAAVGQVALYRANSGNGLVYRVTWNQGGHFYSSHLHLTLDGKEMVEEPPSEVPDPALHPTFVGPTIKRLYGMPLSTDVHYFALDATKPESVRREEVSVLKAIESPAGHFAGVLRIGLFNKAINRAIELPNTVDTRVRSFYSLFICDNTGRLIALPGDDRYADSNGDLRLAATDAPPEVQTALQRPALGTAVDPEKPVADQFVTSGTTYLCTFRSLPDTQGWVVGVVVPRRAYLQIFLQTRSEVLWGSLAMVVVMILLGAIALHAVSSAHSVILHEATLMNDFMLEPSKNSCNFQDINRVLASLERAKTAMRSMGKYVPMDLVRRLYHRGEEPRLGGETTELSVLFTDIASFTEFAEGRDADSVAVSLGAYLEVLTSVIHRERGTIDKFIGDSVMAFWNAPELLPDHAAHACRAALAGQDALALLYQSPAWAGMPGFQTRFGLHHCVASVGHFGSPERFNYTAIGDGINLASRLQNLNKYYGTTIIGSATLRDAAGAGFAWRRLDRVAVKGKTQGIDIFELLGETAAPIPAHVAVYEAALHAYFAGDFQKALTLLKDQVTDKASTVLAARCEQYLEEPPPIPWTGVYSYDAK